MQAIEQKILSRIYGRCRGWAFTKTDFVAEFGEANIHQALSGLTKAGTIRRVCHGVYDYPRRSQLLGELSPDIDQVAQALARKFNWRIQASGETALNLLGLSTQVPGKWLYLSDGPSRQYGIGATGQQMLAFRQSALKDTGLKLRESGLLVQALKAATLLKITKNKRIAKTPVASLTVTRQERTCLCNTYAHHRQVASRIYPKKQPKESASIVLSADINVPCTSSG